MFYVYLLQSLKDKSFYIGQTHNVEKRLERHNNGLVRSTKNKVPWALIGREEYSNRNDARWREYDLKEHSDKKRKFIDKLTLP
ncbi:MAG: GIY-YIG nuclease family protein [Patescibacteria group bacterium]